MKNNPVQSYFLKYAWSMIDYDWVYGHQCIDICKHFASEILKRPLGSFGGSAKTGWKNTANTFPSTEFQKIDNDYWDPNQVPLPWDIIFFNMGTPYDHVGIVLEAKKGENKIRVINQNMGSGDGQGYDDRVIVSEFTYNNCYGWYRYNKFIAEYEGIPVFITQEQPSAKPKVRAYYKKVEHGWPYIVLLPKFFEATKKVQNSILEHEYAHYVWYTYIPDDIKVLWKDMSDLNLKTKAKFLLRGKNYTNGYINSYASTSYIEDFAECWEHYSLGKVEIWENLYIPLKIDTAVALMKKYDPRFAKNV